MAKRMDLARLDAQGKIVRSVVEKTLARLKVTAAELGGVKREYIIGLAVEFGLSEGELETVVHMRREFGAGVSAVRHMLRRGMFVDEMCELYRTKSYFTGEFKRDAWIPSLIRIRAAMKTFSELTEMDGDEAGEQLVSAIREVNNSQEPEPKPPSLVLDDLIRVARRHHFATLDAAAEYLVEFEERYQK